MRYYTLLLAIMMVGCKPNTSPGENPVSAASRVDAVPGSCAYLTTNQQGALVLSWIRQADSTKSVLCYATSPDGGSTFSGIQEIASSSNIYPHAENLPKLLFKPSGEIIAVWGEKSRSAKNPYAGLVYYAQSFDSGRHWSKAHRLVADTTAVDQRYFDVALLPGGEAAIIWLDNRKAGNEAGSSLYFAQTKGGEGFRDHRRISGPCCECCRTDLFVDKNKNIHVLYRAILNDSIRDMVHAVSTNMGESFSAPVKISNDNWVIDGCPHTGPAMAENNDGLYFTWFTAGHGTGVFYNRSLDNGKTFSNKTALSSTTGRHPQLTALGSGMVGIVWDESVNDSGRFSSRVGFTTASSTRTRAMQFLSPDSIPASFPVIATINNQAVVAYTGTSSGKPYVYYKKLNGKY